MSKSFSELCPFWSKAIREGLIIDRRVEIFATIDGVTHSLENFACCIVGEAHGFSDKYAIALSRSPEYCQDCQIYACNLHAYFHSVARFNRHLDDFVKHFDEVHLGAPKQGGGKA